MNQKKMTFYELKHAVHSSEIASIKSILLELIRLINDPSATAKQLKDIVEVDPPLSSSILRLANSAYYGMSKRISDIQEAIIWIGFDIVKQIAISMKALELFIGNELDIFFSRDKLWRFSVASALTGKFIYRREFKELGNNIYSMGLLHNIGHIMMEQFQPDDFKQIMIKYRTEPKNLYEIEQALLGYDHALLASEVMKEWDFHEDLYLPIRYHHQPLLAPAHVRKDATMLFVIDQLCTHFEFGFSDIKHTNRFNFLSSISLYNLEERALDIIMEAVEEEILKMEQLGWF
ncbi:MAG TPA: HDOD domain-containing protein [Candidatus Cloacimonadota bacterium]|nr:HDOD domain-containing protein [Candidatus Cloacimonadota bacterium]HQB40559.1 HDOD domain-containing protein [Candidatus Cloacimonadota bacterium]